VTRGQLPQRAGSLGLNGGWTATAVPPATVLVCKVHTYQAESPTQDITGYSDLLTGTKHRTFSANHLAVTNKTVSTN